MLCLQCHCRACCVWGEWSSDCHSHFNQSEQQFVGVFQSGLTNWRRTWHKKWVAVVQGAELIWVWMHSWGKTSRHLRAGAGGDCMWKQSRCANGTAEPETMSVTGDWVHCWSRSYIHSWVHMLLATGLTGAECILELKRWSKSFFTMMQQKLGAVFELSLELAALAHFVTGSLKRERATHLAFRHLKVSFSGNLFILKLCEQLLCNAACFAVSYSIVCNSRGKTQCFIH